MEEEEVGKGVKQEQGGKKAKMEEMQGFGQLKHMKVAAQAKWQADDLSNVPNNLLRLAATHTLSKHSQQTRRTARKEQREAGLSKKAVTLPLPLSSRKDARLCSHNMLTCANAATTAAHH